MNTAREQERKAKESLRKRLNIAVAVVVIVFITLIARLFQLQILEGEHLADEAERNFIETVDVEAPRGRIFDAKGRPLATNRPAYTLYITARPKVVDPSLSERERRRTKPRREPIDDDAIDQLTRLIDFAGPVDKARFVGDIERLRDDERNGRYQYAIRSGLSDEEYARIVTRSDFENWVEIRQSSKRFYPEGELAAFITGYMRQISAEELEAAPPGSYRLGDRVGKTGIERERENDLRGRPGKHSRVVNNRGVPVSSPPEAALGVLPEDEEPIPGQDIHLSLDMDLQRVAAEAMAGRKAAAVVALEVDTGRVLAMLSVPSVDPNKWEGPISQAEYESWLNSPFKPFVDKSVQEMYFPGSTYKIVSALTMLNDPAFDPDAEVECERVIKYGGVEFSDTHRCGLVDMDEAIVQSCNVYFFQLAIDQGLTLAKMKETAELFGLGDRTGIGINAEARGVVPDEAIETTQGQFQKGTTLNVAIGQGNVKATVLQVAVLYAAIANGGYVVTPTLVDRVETFDGRLVFQTEPKFRNQEAVLSRDQRDRLHNALFGVVNSETGTAFSERLESVRVAGKTGTAEVGKELQNTRADVAVIEGWDTREDHAWFAAYAPADDPEIVVVALVAHGGTGADAAAPIAMRLIDYHVGTRGAGEDSPGRRAPGVPPELPGQVAVPGEEADG